MVISVVKTIEPHHHVRSRTSHLFGGVYSMVPVQPGGSISKIAAVTQEAMSISERAPPRGILEWTGKVRQPPSSRRA